MTFDELAIQRWEDEGGFIDLADEEELRLRDSSLRKQDGERTPTEQIKADRA